MPGHLGAISLKKSHDIVILSFCNIVKGQANYVVVLRKAGVLGVLGILEFLLNSQHYYQHKIRKK